MKLLQRLIFILTLIIASVFLVYALSFSTGWALGQWFGDFFTEAQIFNKLIFKWALWCVILSGGALVFNNHTNRRFYVQNFLVAAGIVYILISSSLKLLEYIPSLKIMYEELPEAFLVITTAINYSQISTFVFDFGIVLAYILMIQAGLIAAITVVKTIIMIKSDMARRDSMEAQL